MHQQCATVKGGSINLALAVAIAHGKCPGGDFLEQENASASRSLVKGFQFGTGLVQLNVLQTPPLVPPAKHMLAIVGCARTASIAPQTTSNGWPPPWEAILTWPPAPGTVFPCSHAAISVGADDNDGISDNDGAIEGAGDEVGAEETDG